MKRFGIFLKATTIGGLFVLLPVVLVVLLISKTLGAVRVAVVDIVAVLIGQPKDAVSFPLAWAALLVLLMSFFLGLIMISRLGRESGRWFEDSVLLRLPGYAAIKVIVQGLLPTERQEKVRPALLTASDGKQTFVYVMEEHADGRLTIFVPSSPSAASGSVQIVGRDKVTMLNVGLGSVVKVLNQWGVGTGKLLARHTEVTRSGAAQQPVRPVSPRAGSN